MAQKKFAPGTKVDRAKSEKITDGIRKIFEKLTGCVEMQRSWATRWCSNGVAARKSPRPSRTRSTVPFLARAVVS